MLAVRKRGFVATVTPETGVISTLPALQPAVHDISVPDPEPEEWFLNWPTMNVLVLQGDVAQHLQDEAQWPLLGDADVFVIQGFNPTLSRLATRVEDFNGIRALQTGAHQTKFGLYMSFQQARKTIVDGNTDVQRDLIESSTEGNPNWWLRRVNNAQIEAPFNPTDFWMCNISRGGGLNSLGETYHRAYWRKWRDLLDPSDTAHDLASLLDVFFQDDVHARMQTPMSVSNGATVVTDPDMNDDGVAESITSFAAAATGGCRLWCEGHIDSKAACEEFFPGRAWFSNSARFPTDYTDSGVDPPLPLSGHPMYGRLTFGLQEGINQAGLGIVKSATSGAGATYSYNGGGSLNHAARLLAIHQRMLAPDSESPGGRNCVVAHLNTVDRTQTTADYEIARLVLAIALMNERVGVSLSIGAVKPLSLDESLFELGAPVGTRSLGTLNETTTAFTNDTPNFTSGVAQFYWQEFANGLVLARLDAPSVGLYPSNDAAVACTLPSPGAGYKWQRINASAYTNSVTGLSMRNQQPGLNNGTDTGATVSLRPYHAIFLRRVADTANEPYEADLLMRTSMPNTVWFHNFDVVAELDAFRWMNGVGNDPNANGAGANLASLLVGDGPCGTNCIQFLYPAGASQPTTLWWRPFAPLNTGSGKAQADPAASGTLTVRNWNPTASSSHTSQFAFGWYGHATYANADPTHFDGNEIWLQIRVKADPRRITGGNEASQFGGGKFVWLTTAETANSLSGGEHVTWSYGRGGSAANQGSDKNYFRVYVHQVNGIGPFDPLDQEEPGTRIQPGSEVAADWFYSGGWDTLLYHVRPGQLSVTSGANSSRLRVYAAREGETSYTKIWDQEYGISSYEARNGLQALILSAYNNGFDFPQEFWHRHAQPIFSKSFIPCPAVHDITTNPLIVAATSLAAGQNTTTIGGNSGITGLTSDAAGSIQWVNRGFYDHARRRVLIHGKYASAQSSPQGGRATMVYDAATNIWASSSVFHINDSSHIGHVYESIAYDPKEQRLYAGRYTNAPDSIFYWTHGTPYNQWGATSVTPWALNSNHIQPVLGWHPNLFGPGDGGLVVIRLVSGTTMQLVTWRRSTDAWSANLVQSTAPTQHGAMTYVRHLDALFVTHAGGNTYRINAGADGVAATPIQIANPPIQCRHIGGGSSGGILIDDPRGLGGPYVLAKGTGVGTVYKYENGAWTTKTYTHPAPTGSTGNGTNWVAISCFPLGVFMFRRDTLSAATIVWRPND